MKRLTLPRPVAICLLMAAASLPAVAPVASAASRPYKQYTIEQFLTTTNVAGASFSHDESRILFSSNETGIFNVYSMPVTGGKATPITSSTTDTTFAVSYFPKDDRVLYTRDQGGNELNHLYVKGPDGTEKDLTPGEKLKAQFAGWSHEGGAFYVLINDRDPKFFDLYKYDAAGYERTLLYKDESGYQLGDISADEKWFAFDKSTGAADSDTYVYNVASKEMKLISKHEGQVQYSAAMFDIGSRWLYYQTNDGSDFLRVRRYEMATGRHEEVEKADWDIAFTSFSHDGKYRVTGINADARTVIKVYYAKTGVPVKLPKLPEGEISSVNIARSESRMSFYVNGDRSPNNLFVLDLGTGSVTRLTDTLSKEIDPEDLVESEVVRFKSFDGMQIPNILYKPLQAGPGAKTPALVWVHGGPGGQTRKGYSALLQYFANHGYTILGINNRGSSGYGQQFFIADDGKHGREPLWDCVEAKKYLAGLAWVDADRIGIIGGSYGGYMVLAAMAYQPDAFKVGVDIFGVSNWVRTLESIPPYWESIRASLYQEIGDPGKDKQKLHDISPLFAADKIRKPLIVLQGANDPRVIKPESDDIVAAVKKNGVPVEYLIFPDEGHGFTKKKNQIEGYGSVLKFLDKHLKGSEVATANAGQ
ncbi:MAG TPA: prolyl oligopeptidase family serine peptidase [Candidatus Polarisedimenticolia bacterium]|jgi:dipeptidyl aminopeptidase/acylaminoacyl peptidase